MEYDADRTKIYELVKSALCDVDKSLPAERISPESKLSELVDSLSLFELPLELEDKVKLAYRKNRFVITEEAIKGIVTVDDAVQALYKEIYGGKEV
ncbi:hypothetical protein COT07_02325 [Candidatus Woesearchaeota archaeon CG07_land_8_20_14_0_80_44_23]|nr:MAG: hypothetical protein COT07_02325 [Candidatus Woesearchaeota archaeon CG07_land_8_20_14_0_80_44_23]